MIEERRVGGALDDVIIVPLALIAIAANKILRFTIAVLMRLLDYTFPLVMEIVWLPLFAARVLGNRSRRCHRRCAVLLPLSETRRRKWIVSMRRRWSWLRRRISYRAFDEPCTLPLEKVWRGCSESRHLTPNTASLVIVAAVVVASDLFRSRSDACGIVC